MRKLTVNDLKFKEDTPAATAGLAVTATEEKNAALLEDVIMEEFVAAVKAHTISLADGVMQSV